VIKEYFEGPAREIALEAHFIEIDMTGAEVLPGACQSQAMLRQAREDLLQETGHISEEPESRPGEKQLAAPGTLVYSECPAHDSSLLYLPRS
jgi:hypothetical protein